MTYQPTITNPPAGRAGKINIGVFFGSRSPEHDVSIITSRMIIEVLKKNDKYNVVPVYLDKKGRWFISSSLGDVKFFRKPEFEKELDKMDDFLLDLDASKGFLKFQQKRKKLFSRSNSIIIDVAFPAFHGSFGEDGTIQGLFEILNVPYAGCGVLASALAMDKIMSRKIFEKENFLIVKNIWFHKNEFERKKKEEIFKEIEQKLFYPLFVKPNKLGSSIGISRVNNQKELDFAIEVVFQFDDKVIIEEAVQNLMEVNCAVIGNDDLIVSLPEQPLYKKDFQTFEEKYLTKGGTIKKGAKKNIIPAPLPKEKSEEIQNLSKKAYRALGCSGISRVDFLIDAKTMNIYINELNTLPGTLQFHLWEASGMSREDLVNKLIDYGLERFNNNKKFIYAFGSNLLNS